MEGKQAEADKVLKEETAPLIQAILNEFGAMNKYQAKQVEEGFKEATATYKSAVIAMSVACLIALLTAIVCAVVITRGIVVPLGRMQNMIQDIAQGEGDLTKRLDDKSNDELGEVARWFNRFIEKLHGIISQISSTSTQVAAASVQVQATAERIATGSEEVAAQAGTVATAGEEMSATSGDIAQN